MTVERVTSVTADLVEAFARLIPQVSSRPAPDAEALAALLADPRTVQLVARDGEEIVGALTLVVYRMPSGITSVVEDVVVDEAARGGGIGAALVEAAKEHALAAGAARISLTSRPAREAANRLYRRLGFEQKETNVYVWRAG
jgi:ribosomal protein S18 acetylase RimI-like enzyme